VIWLPTIQSLMLEKEGIKGAAVAPIIGRNMMLWGVGGIFGYACFGFIADLIGRRPTVALYSIGTPVAGLVPFLAVDSMAPFPYLLVIYGFFVLGVFPVTRFIFQSSSRPMCAQPRSRSVTAGPASLPASGRWWRVSWPRRSAASSTSPPR